MADETILPELFAYQSRIVRCGATTGTDSTNS